MKDLDSLKKLIEALEEFPSIGKKSATRLALNIAKDKFKALKLSNAIEEVITNIKECKLCGNLSEHEICEICLEERDTILSIVENNKDILTIEESGIFKGYYFVLPKLDAEKIDKLISFIKSKNIEEIIFAFSPTLENEAKILYLQDKLKELNLEFSQIAQGVPTGVNLENVDVNSLNKAIQFRVRI